MNSLLFQFIESKNLAWQVGKKDNTRPEKMILEDPGNLRLRVIIIGKQLRDSILSSPPTGLPLLNPSGEERNGRVTIFVIITKQHYDSFSSSAFFKPLRFKAGVSLSQSRFLLPVISSHSKITKIRLGGNWRLLGFAVFTEECGTFVHAQRWLLSKIPIYGVVSHRTRVSWYSAPAGQPKNETNTTLIAPSWFLRVKKMIVLYD